MSKLIDKDLIIRHLNRCINDSDSYTPIVDATIRAIKCYIEDTPTVDAEPIIHGRWIRKSHWCVSCSYCGKYTHDYEGEVELYNYCPNCGAKMDGERKENEQVN